MFNISQNNCKTQLQFGDVGTTSIYRDLFRGGMSWPDPRPGQNWPPQPPPLLIISSPLGLLFGHFFSQDKSWSNKDGFLNYSVLLTAHHQIFSWISFLTKLPSYWSFFFSKDKNQGRTGHSHSPSSACPWHFLGNFFCQDKNCDKIGYLDYTVPLTAHHQPPPRFFRQHQPFVGHFSFVQP